MTAAHWLLEETPVANEGGWEGSGWAEGPWPNRGIVSLAELGTLWAMRPGSYRLEAESSLRPVSFPALWLVGWLLYQPQWPILHIPARDLNESLWFQTPT